MQGSNRVPSLRIRILRTADGQVLPEFIDNGCGLPVHNVDRIFDAFVTTKTKNRMDIGLSIPRTIAEPHSGRLWAENNPDYGAKFSLLLGGQIQRQPAIDIFQECREVNRSEASPDRSSSPSVESEHSHRRWSA
jgi:K+-sensing histidine kinase KdpD